MANDGGKRLKKSHVWDRGPDDWYVEEVHSTRALLKVETFVGACWDPSCGGGNIVRTLREAGLPAIGTDLRRRVAAGTEWFVGQFNFLERLWRVSPAPNIVMNPPYFRAWGTEMFIRKALAIPGVEKIAAFVNIKFLAGEGRSLGLFTEYPPTRIIFVSPRPNCPPGGFLLDGGKAEGGTDDYVWLIWDMGIDGGQRSFVWSHSPRDVQKGGCDAQKSVA